MRSCRQGWCDPLGCALGFVDHMSGIPQQGLLLNLLTCVPQEQTPTASDAEKRHVILQAIDEIVQTGLPDYPGLCIKPYGSYVSGLYCPSGDLDLSIEGVPIAG